MIALALFGSAGRAQEPREFTLRDPVRRFASIEEPARLFHLPGCPRYEENGARLLPAVATLRGYSQHSGCSSVPRVAYRQIAVRQAPKDPHHTDVLFIGNSLTYFNDLPSIVADLSRLAGDRRPIRASFIGSNGLTLEQQWQKGRALRAIFAEAWDYVILQEQSGMPISAPHETAEFIGRFDAAIRESGARTVVFMPWTHQTRASLQGEVAERYRTWTRAAPGILLAPVGSAWQTSREARPGLALYDNGGNHPTLAGSYLAACVLWATITGRSPADLPHTFARAHASDSHDDLAPTDAAFLQETASRAAAR